MKDTKSDHTFIPSFNGISMQFLTKVKYQPSLKSVQYIRFLNIFYFNFKMQIRAMGKIEKQFA